MLGGLSTPAAVGSEVNEYLHRRDQRKSVTVVAEELPTGETGELAAYMGEEPIMGWNEKRLRNAFDQSSPAQKAILKGMASGNGKKWITVSEIVRQMGGKADWNRMAGALGAFGRRCKSRYKAKTRPFERRYNHDLGEKEYLMPASIARASIPSKHAAPKSRGAMGWLPSSRMGRG